MKAVRKISHITDNTLTLYGLNMFNGKTAEVLIRQISKENMQPEHDPLSSARGCLKELKLSSDQFMLSKQTEKELEG